MKTNEEIVAEIEKEIQPTGQVGLLIGVLVARLKYAETAAQGALCALIGVNQSIGNDAMTETAQKALNNLNGVMGRG